MQRLSNKEIYLLTNTLNCVPFVLQDKGVLIDLRNETSVAGIIENADGFMNINLKNAIFIDRERNQYPFEQFMVRERMIRYIHIPDSVNIEKELNDWAERGMKRKGSGGNEKKPKRTFKSKRAEERHKEILEEIARYKQSKDGPSTSKDK